MRGDTLSERASALVEADIVSGALAPGSRIGIIGDGRALRRRRDPASRGAIAPCRAWPRRRDRPARLSRQGHIARATSHDIVLIRTLVEREALRLSMERGNGEWEAGDRRLAASPETLRARQPARSGRGRRRDSTRCTRRFTPRLIAACGSPRLIAAHSDLYDQAYRYRRLMMAGFTDSEAFLADHDRLARFRAAPRT